jgi:GNAT superfamily N-acetyltransferase
MSAPFLIFGLPRSRTYWLSRSLSYGGWTCSHDHAPFLRSVEDVKSWLSMDRVGSVETGAVLWWRLARHFRPDVKMAVVRRDRAEVTERLMRFGFFDRARLVAILARYDRALDACARAPGCLSVGFDELREEPVYARLFEHCLELPFDRVWWEALAGQDLQINLQAQLDYVRAHQPQISVAAAACVQAQRYLCLRRQAAPAPGPDGIVIQEESFPVFWRDAEELMTQHSLAIGDSPDHWRRMNVPVMERLSRAGAVQLMTARMNGRMLGYLTAILVPSLSVCDELLATQLSFFVSPDAGGLQLGRRLQRAAVGRARERGAAKMYMRAGVLGSGRRLGSLYRRMGASDFGQLWELDLREAPQASLGDG